MIIHGYSEEELKKLPDNTVDLIITSPPYADRRKNTYGGIAEDKYLEWFKPIAVEIKRVLKPTGSFFLNIKPHTNKGERSLYVFELVIMLKRELGFLFVEEYCWTKNAFPTGTHGRFKNGFEPVYHFAKGEVKNITFNALACGTPVSEETKSRAFRKNCKTPTNGSGMVVDRDNFKNLEFARPSNVINANNYGRTPEGKLYFLLNPYAKNQIDTKEFNIGKLILMNKNRQIIREYEKLKEDTLTE